jgi:hypothetical protein
MERLERKSRKRNDGARTGKDEGMSDHENSRGKNLGCCENEWQGIVDKIEEAIVMSLANKVLEQAAIKEEKNEEDRKRVKLVELRRFSRKKHLNPPSRKAC